MADDDLMPGKGTYKAVYSREPDGAWIVYIRGHRHEIHTFARSLRTARENIRDALSLWYDDADSATIVDRVELEPALEDELAATEELARLHSDVSRKLAAKRRRAVRVLQNGGRFGCFRRRGWGRATLRSCWSCRSNG
ncbi:MAG: hypothetical protein JRF42_18335 [Deltaproteobacteria bacterium]|nr:hypothetical protein [Deltaproteobacteria bacterium]